jgi:nitroimidazol reductase NimA-like FMN-containing flavoprotein (pyridoxamine 5'-phosphate oxidase superfamily)
VLVASSGDPAAEMFTLDRDECLALLGATSFGRVAVATGEGPPAVRPVNYTFDPSSQSVVFRTARGSKFHALVQAAEAAFEIDGTDAEAHTGWSVIVSGVTEEITGRAELERLAQHVPPSWAPSEKPYWMRLRAYTVSGRRIGPARAPETTT